MRRSSASQSIHSLTIVKKNNHRQLAKSTWYTKAGAREVEQADRKES